MTFHQLAPEDVLKYFSSTIEGLGEEEARIRLARYGPNEIRREHEISPAKIFLSQFTSFIVYILIGAVFISFMLHEYIDGAVMAVMFVIGTIIAKLIHR
jgi:Ca2+-transporting ATPase